VSERSGAERRGGGVEEDENMPLIRIRTFFARRRKIAIETERMRASQQGALSTALSGDGASGGSTQKSSGAASSGNTLNTSSSGVSGMSGMSGASSVAMSEMSSASTSFSVMEESTVEQTQQ